MYATDLADAIRKFDLTVRSGANGWSKRGHGPLSGIKGVVLHHTAGPRTGNYPSLRTVAYGRPGLSGPLAQIGLARDGTVYVFAAGKAYHAGTGYWKGLRSGNSYLLGIEAESTGHGDWTPSQIEAYPRLIAALRFHYGFSSEWCIAHLEWATPKGRKVDVVWPGGPDALRRAADEVYERAVRAGKYVPADADSPKPSQAASRVPVVKAPVKKPSKVKKWTYKLRFKLVVDGKFGPRTVKALQKALRVTIDGDYGPKTKRALQKHLGVSVDGVVGPQTVRALQRRVGTSADGVWGPKTTAALQRALNAGKF